MCAAKAIEHYSYDDYCLWEGKWELIAGAPMAITPSPVIKHQALAGNILFELKKSIGACERCLVLSEEDWKISNDTVLKPDVVLICDEPNDKYITKAPEIIVEIISQSTAKRDELFKYEIYEREKVPFYIIVYPDDCKAKLYKLENNKYSKQGDFSRETYSFEGTTCPAKINFDAVFRAFRR
ncbi:MAG: Uma2 family endonuclease [Gammaproteobacteria bacterium]|jgi:Uma2 family endonuclease|nr:Uma2 family endonuclease [Gammaproteobacteria bacterium]MBT4077896.1 Uma2 family endonuclease [Gammaproteobacteria bacterium]MBT4195115.1 Uma2 family endonuclease [Gammaproteobacteria bacterium]MBT4449088.1 Uma2 family endonuclease [Gammaproteobacteria bacterium]MBT4859649.1 Uma2 family endonuclease [Gammaproteobacteria bacterium]